jgi:hypothetical protein
MYLAYFSVGKRKSTNPEDSDLKKMRSTRYPSDGKVTKFNKACVRILHEKTLLSCNFGCQERETFVCQQAFWAAVGCETCQGQDMMRCLELSGV